MSMTTEYLSRILAYNRWANREAFESIRGTNLHRSRKLFGHIVSAEWTWLSRLSAAAYEGVTWPEWTFDECDEQLQAVESAWADCLSGIARDGNPGLVSYVVRMNREPIRTPARTSIPVRRRRSTPCDSPLLPSPCAWP